MHGVKEIIEEASALPVEERAVIVDSLLRTLNAPELSVDEAWVNVATKRLEELRSGLVQASPADDVFARARERFTR